MSSFSWLDYSQRERRRALDAIALFGDEDTVDELGIGTVRDAFSDLLFPGTSTIQTHLRYFLFIPWIFQRLEKRRISSQKMADRARKIQFRLRNALMEGGEQEGVIGLEAGLHVQRLPSSTYWYGLLRWGIRNNVGSEERYFRSLDGFYLAGDDTPESEDEEAGLGGSVGNWHRNLPEAPDGFLDETTFNLTVEESDYLFDRITARAPGSLLAALIHSDVDDSEAQFPWEHTAASTLDMRLRGQLGHARNFSECMHGPALLYNLILARELSGDDEVAKYETGLGHWWSTVRSRMGDLRDWNRTDFWRTVRSTNPRIPGRTQQFVKIWLDLMFSAKRLNTITNGKNACDLIQDRERQLKGNRARIDNGLKPGEWKGESGATQLAYRWRRPVRTFIRELLAPRQLVVAGA